MLDEPDARRNPPTERCMLEAVKAGADFSRGCALSAGRPLISTIHPHHRAIRESLYASTPSPVILATADIHSLPQYLVARKESQGENRPFSNPILGEVVQHLVYGHPRIHLPPTPVNKGKSTGRGP